VRCKGACRSHANLPSRRLPAEDAPDGHRDLQTPDGGGQSSPRGDLNQSERDWAFAKRALARGDEPEEVIRRIADYWGDDKHDPNYYARLTVAKAQAQLTSERQNPGTSAVSKSPPADKEPSH
jgi:hypothetical protein